MRWRTLDEIVHSNLINNGLSVHYYFRYLKFAADCLRELHFDSLKTVNTKKLLVNSYKAITLPCDYVDFVRIGVGSGQLTTSLHGSLHMNRLNNYDVGGKPTLYGDWWGYRGRYGVWGYSSYGDSYSILKERGEIQLHESAASSYVILEYISDGSAPDNATKVDPYAQKTIETYQDWQDAETNRSIGSGEKQRKKDIHDAEVRKLRARMDDMTLEDVRVAMRGMNNSIFINADYVSIHNAG